MTAKVADASAIGALVFNEPEAERVAERLTEGPLYVPALLSFEVANLCWKKIRRHPDKRQALLQAFALFTRMELYQVETDLEGTLRLADETGLTAYDASYLWLARRLRCELVTLDRKLAAQTAT